MKKRVFPPHFRRPAFPPQLFRPLLGMGVLLCRLPFAENVVFYSTTCARVGALVVPVLSLAAFFLPLSYHMSVSGMRFVLDAQLVQIPPEVSDCIKPVFQTS